MSDPRIAERFGHNLLRARRRAELSQEGLAELAELHRNDISLLETGKRLPGLGTLLKITAAADATPRELLADLHWRPAHWVRGEFYIEDGPEWTGRSHEGRG